MSITCGNRAKHNGTTGTHRTVAAVKACFLDATTFACDWQYEARDRYGVIRDEDGEIVIITCGALAWNLPGNRGWACENGHEHVTAQARRDERWDYAEDRHEAERLAKVGVASVQMDGRPWA